MADTLAAVTDDGVLLATNSHRRPNEPQLLRWQGAADHEADAEVATTGGTRIPQARRTHAVLLSQVWWAWGAEAGANEHGVAMAAQPVLTRGGSRPDGAMPGSDLLRLALERAADRREAVEAVVGLLEAHGQDAADGPRGRRGPRDTSFVVADRSGVTLLETAGSEWATEEVAGARSVSAALTIEGFADRHADRLRGRLWATADRRARTQAAAASARGPAALMGALRDHGSDRPPDLPRYRRATGAVGGSCAHAGGMLASTQTTASWLSDLRATRPRQAGTTDEAGTHWVTGTAAPCTSVFWPAAVGVPVELDAGSSPPREFDDPARLWWRHERLHRAALRDADRALMPLAIGRDALEELWLADPPASIEALGTADDWRAAALEGLRALEPADTRPLRVAVQWRRWGARAGPPGWARPGSR